MFPTKIVDKYCLQRIWNQRKRCTIIFKVSFL